MKFLFRKPLVVLQVFALFVCLMLPVHMAQPDHQPSLAIAYSASNDETITRAELAKEIVSMLNADVRVMVNPDEFQFVDVDDSIMPYIETAYRLGIVNGVSDTEFAPDAYATKEQAIVVFIRALNLLNQYDNSILTGQAYYQSLSPWAKEAMSAVLHLEMADALAIEKSFQPSKSLNQADIEKIKTLYQNEISKISIVHTNDIHGRIIANESNGEMGFAKIAEIVNNTRANNTNTLVFDMGDTFHGTNYVNMNQGEAGLEVMNLIGYDAMVPGNHDFNFGQERLLDIKQALDFPMVSANIMKGDAPFLPQHTIVEVAGKKFALIGVTATDTVEKTHPDNITGLIFNDEISPIKALTEELKETVEHIIILSHAGLDTEKKIAEQVDGITLVLGGHSHDIIERPIKISDTYVTQAHEYGKAVGMTNILYYNDNFIGINGHLVRDSEELIPDQEVESVLNSYQEQVEEALKEKITTISKELDGERADVRTRETNLGNLIADAMRQLVDAEIAMQNGGGIRASIPAGEVTLGHIVTTLPFTNTVVKMEMTGQQILDSLEHSVRSYPEQNGGFLHISGMNYAFDPNNEVGQRVSDVVIAGSALDLSKKYSVATNDFVAAGGDGYSWINEGVLITDTGELLSTVVINYLKSTTTLTDVEERIQVK